MHLQINVINMWLIPMDAEKCVDGRTKKGKELQHEQTVIVGR